MPRHPPRVGVSKASSVAATTPPSQELTLHSSSLTSQTPPSINVHFTISVSGLAPFTSSQALSLLQKVWKLGSLIRCQTWERGEAMTADSETVVEVGGGVGIVCVGGVVGGVVGGLWWGFVGGFGGVVN